MWDGFQRETLAALGHVVYRRADAPMSMHDTNPHDSSTHDSSTHDASAHASRMHEPHAHAPRAHQASVARQDMQSPLLLALARAADVPIDRLAGLPSPDQLRSAAAKRALWPRLRALRSTARS